MIEKAQTALNVSFFIGIGTCLYLHDPLLSIAYGLSVIYYLLSQRLRALKANKQINELLSQIKDYQQKEAVKALQPEEVDKDIEVH